MKPDISIKLVYNLLADAESKTDRIFPELSLFNGGKHLKHFGLILLFYTFSNIFDDKAKLLLLKNIIDQYGDFTVLRRILNRILNKVN